MTDPVLIHVTWIDTELHSFWETLDDLKQSKPVIIHSIGWLLIDDDDRLVLAGSRDDKNDKFNSVSVIPRRNVQTVQRLRKSGKGI